jgi:cell division protein CrgA
VPKSRVRKKSVYTPPPTRSARKKKVSPVWLAPTMIGCFLIGLAWIVVYYATNGGPSWMSPLGGWNLVFGFGLIVVGVVLSTQWY